MSGNSSLIRAGVDKILEYSELLVGKNLLVRYQKSKNKMSVSGERGSNILNLLTPDAG